MHTAMSTAALTALRTAPNGTWSRLFSRSLEFGGTTLAGTGICFWVFQHSLHVMITHVTPLVLLAAERQSARDLVSSFNLPGKVELPGWLFQTVGHFAVVH